MLGARLSLNRCKSTAGNAAIVLMFIAVRVAQSRVISLTAIPLVSLGTVMSVSLVGLTVAHGVGLRVCFVGDC